MADNTTLDGGAGGDTIRTEDKAGIKTQVVIIDRGGTGAEDLWKGLNYGTDDGGTTLRPLKTNADGSVCINDNAGAVTVDGTVAVTDGGGSITVDGTVTATIAAGATTIAKAEDVASADADVGVPAMAVRKAAPANTSGADGDYEMLQMSAGRLWTSATIDAAIPAGNNNIGDVDIASIAAGDNNIGNVDIVTVPAPLSTTGGGVEATALRVTIANDSTGVLSVDDNGGSLTVDGSVTANAGTDLNTSLLALEAGGNLAAAAASLSVMDDWDEANRAAVNTIAGQVGVQGASGVVTALTQRVVLATDVALPAGNNNIGDVDIASIAAGNNNIGDVDVASIAAGDNNIGNVDIVTVPAPLSTTGGGVEAAALRVTIANDSTGVVSVDDNGGSLTVDGTVTANPATAYGKTITYVSVAQGASGSTTLAAASPGNKHKIIGAMLFMSAAGTLKFVDGAADLTGAMDIAANGGFVLPVNIIPYQVGSTNTALSITTTVGLAKGVVQILTEA